MTLDDILLQLNDHGIQAQALCFDAAISTVKCLMKEYVKPQGSSDLFFPGEVHTPCNAESPSKCSSTPTRDACIQPLRSEHLNFFPEVYLIHLHQNAIDRTRNSLDHVEFIPVKLWAAVAEVHQKLAAYFVDCYSKSVESKMQKLEDLRGNLC